MVRFSRLRNCTRGTAAIEFALLLPAMLTLLLGMADYATLLSRTMQVNAAAQAGADWAARNGWDARGVLHATDSEVATLDSPHARARLLTGCLLPDARINESADKCADGDAPGRYVLVTVTARSMPLLLHGETLLPQHVSGRALVRIT
jgi:Flp pilus assembly protein TadG